MGLTVEQPRDWRLALHIDGASICAVCRPVLADADPLVHFMPLPDTSVEALEDAVYATPGLLDDFSKVDVLVRTPDFTTIPDGLDADAVASIMGLDADEAVVLRSPVPECHAEVVWSLPAAVHNFIARTFRNPAMTHPSAILARFFAAGGAGGNGLRVFVNFSPAAGIDIIALDTGARLRLLSGKNAATDSDALYFIFAALESVGFDAETDRLLLCGDRRRRQALAPVLRKYVRTVLPVLSPAGLPSPDNVPYPLTILPLCE